LVTGAAFLVGAAFFAGAFFAAAFFTGAAFLVGAAFFAGAFFAAAFLAGAACAAGAVFFAGADFFAGATSAFTAEPRRLMTFFAAAAAELAREVRVVRAMGVSLQASVWCGVSHMVAGRVAGAA
jgi:hypothetical protein